MDSPQHARHLSQGCRQLIHLLIGKDAAAVTELTRTYSDHCGISSWLANMQLHTQIHGKMRLHSQSLLC